MQGETNLNKLLQNLKPVLNKGEYVFSKVSTLGEGSLDFGKVVGMFREEEGVTIILPRKEAEKANLEYHFIASWITLEVHSSLEAVGLTAAFSQALAKENISCNVVAGYYHDHIFVTKQDEVKALKILENLAQNALLNKK